MLEIGFYLDLGLLGFDLIFYKTYSFAHLSFNMFFYIYLYENEVKIIFI